ncbi:MAG: GcrA family cell cycle regulator [Caulobacteraceae bacterium]|nr:GcrA family cell cycle regulator [Caulobacteraceae bacterium]
MSAWNEDRLTRLKRLWPQGRSADWIARELGGGLTRNAVLGQVRRLGLSSVAGNRAPRPSRQEVPALVAPAAGSATILSVRRTDCRWPYGDPAEKSFSLCGSPVRRGAFCAAHAALAYRGPATPIDALMAFAERVP